MENSHLLERQRSRKHKVIFWHKGRLRIYSITMERGTISIPFSFILGIISYRDGDTK